MAFDVDYFTLTPTDATHGYVVLSYVPTSPTNVAMDIISGTAQHLLGVPLIDSTGDFGVSDSTVLWNSPLYSLNGVLSTGDRLRIIYDRS